jgi:Putative peptidoglycan binding domain
MFKKTLILAAFALASSSVFAQNAGLGEPPVPNEYGKCYAKCRVADKYETVERMVEGPAAAGKTRTIPAKFETVSEQVLVKEASKRGNFVPAKFTTRTEKILVKEGGCKIVKKPAQYASNSTRRMVKEASGHWVKKLKSPNCLKEATGGTDCYVLCWEEVPAQYTYDTERTIVKAESEERISEEPVYKTITVSVLAEPARYDEVDVPAQYTTVSKQRVVECAQTVTEAGAAKQMTKKERVLVSAGGFTEWVEVVCDKDMTESLVTKVQKALNEKGYNVGTPDGRMGGKTREMLMKYQKENNLPEGNMNKATVESLGVH